jgi:hypothetical protein
MYNTCNIEFRNEGINMVQYVTRYGTASSPQFAILPTLQEAKAHVESLGYMARGGYHHVFIIECAEGFGIYWSSEKRYSQRNAEEWLKGGCVAYGKDDDRTCMIWTWEDMKPITENDTWRELFDILDGKEIE